jgi:hypothetical protein
MKLPDIEEGHKHNRKSGSPAPGADDPRIAIVTSAHHASDGTLPSYTRHRILSLAPIARIGFTIS